MKTYNGDDLLKQICNGDLSKLLNETPSLKCQSKVDGFNDLGSWKCRFTYSANNKEKTLNLAKRVGIYFIYDSDEKIYYVGESLNLYKRLERHYHSGKIISLDDKEVQSFDDYTKNFRDKFTTKVLLVNKVNLNSLKYELRAIEQLCYITLSEDMIHKKLMSWDNKLFDNAETRNLRYKKLI